jgi:uncharacterized protein
VFYSTIILALIGCISLLYATVGQAGGTAFVAVMALTRFPAAEIRPTASFLNVVAAGCARYVQEWLDEVIPAAFGNCVKTNGN